MRAAHISSSMVIFSKLLRSVGSVRNYSAKNRQCEEVRIPWVLGEIAGKWWGPKDVRPIVALHGWQDNCGTFDRLVPLLPLDTAVLALDLPGHGYTSPYPPGMFYHGLDSPIFMRRIVEHFGWPKMSLMGHSLGAISSFIYTTLYPNDVDFLICIDALCPFRAEKSARPEGMADTINKFLKYDAQVVSSGVRPSYTFEELEQLLFEGSRKSIDKEMCKYILRRNIAPSDDSPGKFYFTRDPRLKVGALAYISKEDVLMAARRIICPLFFSLGQTSQLQSIRPLMLDTFAFIEGHNKNVEYHSPKGTHHLHLNNPEELANKISLFIKRYSKGHKSNSNTNDKIKVVQAV